MELPKVLWMPESLSGSVFFWWSHMHTNVYALYDCVVKWLGLNIIIEHTIGLINYLSTFNHS